MADIAELKEILGSKFREFEYVELLAIIHEYSERFIENGDISVETVPNTSFTFPASDISKITYFDKKVELEARFLSLTGVASPLQYDLISSIDKVEGGEALKFLLTIINRRIYKLFAYAIERNRLTASFGKESFAESGTENFFKLKNSSNNFGSIAFKGRSAEGLEVMLKKWFMLNDIKVEEFTGGWIKINHKTELNGRTLLGNGALLGGRVFSPSSAFKVTVFELEREQFEKRKFREKIKDAVFQYVSDPLDFEIEFRLKQSDVVSLSLSKNCRVGLGFGVSLGKVCDGSVERLHIHS